MLTRIVSLIAIVAVTACPLWCSSGLCQGGQCCAPQVCPASLDHASTTRCCERCASPPPQHEHAPVPQESSCQGICGGAVLEKPSQIDGPQIVTLLSHPADALHTVAGSMDARDGSARWCEWYGGAANIGRSLCALHQVFLC